MIDTHCHLDVARFDADRADVIVRARAAGIEGILVPAIRPRTWAALRSLRGGIVEVAFGVHPQIVPDLDPDERVDADAIAAACEGAAAVGECGLDGATGEREAQEQLFRAHVRAARTVHLPLVVHVLGGGHDRALAILRDEGAAAVGGVMHSYSGSAELVRDYAALGFAFSFAGAVTRTNAKKPLAAVRAVPAELLLVETDAPDQTPSRHANARPAHQTRLRTGAVGENRRAADDLARERATFARPAREACLRTGEVGENRRAADDLARERATFARNEPAYLPDIIAAVAEARGEDPEATAQRTAANARSRFARW